MKTSRKFATPTDILVAKGKTVVTNGTVSVAMSSPVHKRMLCLGLPVMRQDAQFDLTK